MFDDSSAPMEPSTGEEVDGEEVVVGKHWKRAVVKPSAEEVRRHMISHVPFRSWCEYCVKGKAKDSPHYRVLRGDVDEEPVFSWDYMYMKSSGAASSSTEYVGDMGDKPILVGKDRKAK